MEQREKQENVRFGTCAQILWWCDFESQSKELKFVLSFIIQI